MDIDCDGYQGPKSVCGNTDGTDTQGRTTFRDQVRAFGIQDLDPSVHNYVVFGNENDDNEPGFPVFDPKKYGVQPLSLMAVVCGKKMVRTSPKDQHCQMLTFVQFYGFWGDSNGSDGQKPVIGEASISMARLCFGSSMTNDNGHDEADVMYIAFTGQEAVLGKNGAAWRAKTSLEFQNDAAFNKLGDKLVRRI
jgi:hypothetical protein